MTPLTPGIACFSRGFTLVEMLVYLGITLLVTVAGVTTFISLNTMLVRNAAERTLTHEASASLERIVRTVRESDGVHAGLSSFGVSMGTLTVATVSTTTTFSVVGGRLVVSENGVAQGNLTSGSVVVQNVVFHRYVNARTELVRVALTLTVSVGGVPSTRTFYASAVPRGLYE